MATFEDIIQEVLLNLEGFTGDQEIYGTLAANINNTASSFAVNGSIFPDGSGFTTGLIEVNEELIYAQSFNRTTGTFSGCLRGWRGTTATAHLLGTLVRNNPKFPRIAIKRAINDTIKNLHPRVFAIKSYEVKYIAAQNRYLLPADARNVIAVMYDEPGPSKSWLPVKTWNFEYVAANDVIGTTSVYETSPAVNVYQGFPGRNIQVIYQAEASELVNLGDNLSTTGLPDWVRDLIVYGACWRLSTYVDAGRINSTSVEQATMIANANYGAEALRSGQNLSKYFFALYNTRLQEAETRMQNLYPATIHYKR